MAVSLYFGMTESGKSYLAEKQIERVNRSIVFDYAHCFKSKFDLITSDFSNENLLKIFQKFKDRDKFKICFRPIRGVKVESAFNKVAWLSLLLGRQAIRNKFNDRLILLVDEADQICSSHYQSDELKNVVNWGRHELVDSWFIARTPQRLHTDLRANASKIYVFKLCAETSVRYFSDLIEKKAGDRIRRLEKWSYLAWKDSGEVIISDKNQNVIESWS